MKYATTVSFRPGDWGGSIAVLNLLGSGRAIPSPAECILDQVASCRNGIVTFGWLHESQRDATELAKLFMRAIGTESGDMVVIVAFGFEGDFPKTRLLKLMRDNLGEPV